MVGDQKLGPIHQNGEKKAHGDAVGQERAGHSSWGREPFYEGEGRHGQGQAVVVVVGCIQGK